MVRWSDLTTYQGRQLLPKTADHDLSHRDEFFTSCYQSCHSFQKTMAPYNWDKSGWVTRVRYMRDVILSVYPIRPQHILAVSYCPARLARTAHFGGRSGAGVG
jgi:hypothetical protein